VKHTVAADQDGRASAAQQTLFRDALLVTMDPARSGAPETGDLLVTGTTITAVGGRMAPPPGASVVDASGKLIMPGLVNAHTHSGETFFRGRYERMPLETWLLYAYPPLMDEPIGQRLLYLRTLLLAMESLHNGVTTLCDDFFDPPAHDLDRLGTVFSAYEDAGIRANVSSAVMNIPMLDTLPYARAIVPQHLQAMLDGSAPITAAAYADFCAAAFARLHDRAGRLRFMMAPSAPQRCTADLLLTCHELAREHRVPLHTHVVETKTQCVTGYEIYGKSLIRYMHDLGILDRHTAIAHSVWVSDEDMALMGEAGCAVAHNAVSNQKLGAGIAPLRRLLDAGVTVGLGTDGLCSNDSARIFDVMRVAALIHSTSGPDSSAWVRAEEVLHAATLGGARSALLGDVTGSLEVGKAADLLMLNLAAHAFVPLNDPIKQLVWSENGSSIELVMVAGEIVVRDRRLTRVNEAEILAEIQDLAPGLLAAHAALENRNQVFEPYFFEIHRRACANDVGFDRYAGDMPQWRRKN
jgi:5-methylthioadenosine/S-adenosylhomocysteine deaminase